MQITSLATGRLVQHMHFVTMVEVTVIKKCIQEERAHTSS